MDTLIAALVVLSSAIIAIVGNVVASELYDRTQSLSTWLVDRAIARLPSDERARYREEWYAHLEALPGNFNRLIHAAGCWRTSGRLSKFLAGVSWEQGHKTGFSVNKGYVDEMMSVLTEDFWERTLQSSAKGCRIRKIKISCMGESFHDGVPFLDYEITFEIAKNQSDASC